MQDLLTVPTGTAKISNTGNYSHNDLTCMLCWNTYMSSSLPLNFTVNALCFCLYIIYCWSLTFVNLVAPNRAVCKKNSFTRRSGRQILEVAAAPPSAPSACWPKLVSLFLQTASSSFTDPMWSWMTRSCSGVRNALQGDSYECLTQ